MIKDFFGYIHWQWSNLEGWQKFWFLTMFIMGSAFGASAPYDRYLALLAMIMLAGQVVVGFIFPAIKASYENYKKEKYGLFETIKDSDK